MTYVELAVKILKEVKKQLTIKEIWDYAVEKGLVRELSSVSNTPQATLISRIGTNIRKRGDGSPFLCTNDSPRKFYLKENHDTLNSDIADIKRHAQQKGNYLEKDLHPLLAHFAFHQMQCYTKTISHSRSTKEGYGEWLHPDMVGCIFPVKQWKGWDKTVSDLSSLIGDTTIKLVSFELKRILDLGYLREYFFQTVSNSSWANEGYIVAAEIPDKEELSSELSRLSSSFGIGVIKLNMSEPSLSEILFPSREKPNLDWETIVKLAEKNSDFKTFLERVNKDFKGKEIREEKYDKYSS